MTLRAHLSLRLGELDLGVELDVPGGAVTAVLGPNGAGKTTLLRCLAGSLGIDEGSIVLGGVVFDEPPNVFVPQEQRHVGVVHQDYLLFPHLTALDNVAFGLRARKRSTRDARESAHRWLARVGAATNADQKPRTLSGGQAQRVALARALATEPRALLLDEPLAALDVATRPQIRRDLRRYLEDFGGPTVLVTHDPVDALALADRVAILESGHLTQAGTLAEVTTRPRSRYVADLIGTNLVNGSAVGTVVRAGDDRTFTTAEPHRGEVFLTIAPAAVALHRHEPEGSPRNRWSTSIRHLDLLGDRVRVHLAPPLDLVAEITPNAADEMGLAEGEAVWASVKATEIVAYPR
jgi:molybdate transport system ATP-binding protein